MIQEIDWAKFFNVDTFEVSIDLTGKYFTPVIRDGKFIWNKPTYHEYPMSTIKWSIKDKQFRTVVAKEVITQDYITKIIEFSRGNINGNS